MNEVITFILAIFAYIYKIQSSWFWEIVSMAVMLLIVFGSGYFMAQYIRKRNVKQSTGFKGFVYKTIKWLITGIFIIFGMGLILHICLIAYIVSNNGKLEDYAFESNKMTKEKSNVNILDERGNIIYTITSDNKNREYAKKEDIPQSLKDAIVATEDKTFYEHSGVSIKGYARAIFYKVTGRSEGMHGGSTITQQLVKNVNEDIYGRTVVHKYQEALMAIILENKYSKEEILEMYLNSIFLGTSQNGNLYGVGVASEYYFNKKPMELTVSQSAYLAGLAKAPSTYTTDLKLGNERKNVVLDLMKQYGAITSNQKMKEQEKEIKLIKEPNSNDIKYAAYADYVVKEATEKLNISKEEIFENGYSFRTYIDKDMQENMYDTAENTTFSDDRTGEDIVQVGMAAVNNETRKIVAIYGGRNYRYGYTNHAYNLYQPGSILKPLVVYGPALDSGKFTAYSKIVDEETDFGEYKPKNSSNTFAGKVTLEQALIRSLNIPAVKVLQNIGVEYGINTLTNVGIKIEEEDKGLHVALGGMEKGVSPIQMAQAYSTFPNYGYYEEANAIKTVEDGEGRVIHQEAEMPKQRTDVFKAETAFNMTEMLEKVVSSGNGTGKAAKIGRPVAGKTGTAQEPLLEDGSGNRAAWFVGYTPEFTVAVYNGFDKPSKENNLSYTGGSKPAEMFSSVMKKQMKNYLEKEFAQPVTASSLYDLDLLKGADNLKASFNKDKKRVELKWEAQDKVDGIIYKIYSQNESGEFVQIGKTSDLNYYDYSINTKADDYEELSGGVMDVTSSVFENIKKSYSNVVGEFKYYYIVSEYGDVQSEQTKTVKKWITKD